MSLVPDQALENRKDRIADLDRGSISPILLLALVAAGAFLVWFPIGRSEFTGPMWFWALVAVGVVGANLVVPSHTRNATMVKWVTLATFLAFLIVFPIDRAGSTMTDMGLFAIFGIAVIGMNLTQGYAGQISLAQAAFLGIGAYVSVILNFGREVELWGISLDLPEIGFLWTIPIAIVVSMVFSVLIGMPALKVRGPWLAFVTLAFNLLVFLVLNNEEGLTRGARGIRVLRDDFTILGFDMLPAANFYYASLAGLVLATALVWWIVRSPWGRALKALRDNPNRASSLGVDVRMYTLLAFAIGAGLAGGAGALYARQVEYIEPRSFFINQSFDFLLAAVIGGLGTLSGPFFGVLFITLIADRLRFTGDWYRVWFGIFVVFMIVVAPKGISGTFNEWRSKLQQRLAARE